MLIKDRHEDTQVGLRQADTETERLKKNRERLRRKERVHGYRKGGGEREMFSGRVHARL